MRYKKIVGIGWKALAAAVLVMAPMGCQTNLSSRTAGIQKGGPNDHPVDWQTSQTTVINRHAPAVVEQNPETGEMVVVNDGMSTDQIVLTRDADYKVLATIVDVGSNAFLRSGAGAYYWGMTTPENNWNETGNYRVVQNVQGGYVVTQQGAIAHNVSGAVDVNGNIVHSGTVTQQHQGTVDHSGTVTHVVTQPPPR